MIKILNLNLVLVYEYQNARIFLLGQKKLLLLNKLKILCCGHVISDLNGEEIVGTSYKKELKKANQIKFRIEKVIKKKGDKLYIKWKGYGNSFNSWIDKKDVIV